MGSRSKSSVWKESLPQHLPVVDRVFDVPEDKRVCPTHGAMTCMGCDETETLVQEPAKLYRFKNKFMKYACPCCSENGIVSSDLYDQSQILPKSDFAGVIGYIHGNWAALLSYAWTGFVPIDNNGTERLMKQVALGRKNWLFVGNVAAGERSAMLISLVSSAKRRDLDVWKYVKDVLDQLLEGETDYHKLLPDVWKQTHPEAVREHRGEERRDKAERKQYDRAKRLLAAKEKRNATA